jgi:hypothetical protein
MPPFSFVEKVLRDLRAGTFVWQEPVGSVQ